jgi:hypothetical protein
MPPPVITPSGLSFALARTPERDIDAFAAKFRTHEDDFGSDTSANYTPYVLAGTSTVAIGSGSATFTGGSAGGVALRRTTGSWPVAPYAYAEMRVTAASNATPFVGFASDPNNFCWLYIYNNQAGVDSKVAGAVSQTAPSGSFAPPYTLRLVVCWPELWAWIDTGSGFAVAVRHGVATGTDLRLLSQWQAGWRPLAGFDRSAGGSGTMDWFHSGYVGGFGVRDMKPVTYLDGKPYSPDGRIWVTATQAIGADFLTNHIGVMSLDATTYEPRIESLQFFRIANSDRTNPAATKDLCTALYGGQLLRDSAAGKWLFVVNGWGLGNVSTGVKIWKAETTADVTAGGTVHELDAYQLDLPTANGVYDNAQYYDGANWHLVCAEANAPSNWTNYHARLFSGPDLDSLVAGATDTTRQAEGLNWARIGGDWYATAGGTGGPHHWDASLAYLGSLSGSIDTTGTTVAFTDYGSHFATVGVPRNGGDDTEYVAVLFDQDQISGAGATKGRLAVFDSGVHAGAEWAWDGGDTTAPIVAAGWSTDVAGTTVEATLSEPCVPGSGTGGFTLSGTSATVASWTIVDDLLTLTLTGAIAFGETVAISYTAATASSPIEDAAGNPLADFGPVSVANGVPEPEPSYRPWYSPGARAGGVLGGGVL